MPTAPMEENFKVKQKFLLVCRLGLEVAECRQKEEEADLEDTVGASQITRTPARETTHGSLKGTDLSQGDLKRTTSKGQKEPNSQIFADVC